MRRFFGNALRVTASFIDRTSNGAGYLSAFLNIVLCLLVFSGVIARYVFSNPIPWRDEICQYIFIYANILALCYATYAESHVSAEMLYDHFPPRIQDTITIIGYCLVLLCISFIVYFGFQTVHTYYVREWRSETLFEFTLWPIIGVIPVGFVLFGLQCISKLRSTIIRMQTGASATE